MIHQTISQHLISQAVPFNLIRAMVMLYLIRIMVLNCWYYIITLLPGKCPWVLYSNSQFFTTLGTLPCAKLNVWKQCPCNHNYARQQFDFDRYYRQLLCFTPMTVALSLSLGVHVPEGLRQSVCVVLVSFADRDCFLIYLMMTKETVMGSFDKPCQQELVYHD